MSDITPPDPHLHTIELTSSEIETMKSGTHVKGVTTSTNGGHNHVLDLYYNQKSNISKCFLDMYLQKISASKLVLVLLILKELSSLSYSLSLTIRFWGRIISLQQTVINYSFYTEVRWAGLGMLGWT